MKKLKCIPAGYFLTILFGIWLISAQVLEIDFGKRMAGTFYTSSIEMIFLVPFVFILIGLLDAWIPQQQIQKYTGEKSGFLGAVYIILFAMFQGAPLYGAIATAHLLWEKGCSMRNTFLYLGAYSTLKVPMLLFEVSFMGWKFALVRAVVALPVFILIAEVMTAYTRLTGLQLRLFEDDNKKSNSITPVSPSNIDFGNSG